MDQNQNDQFNNLKQTKSKIIDCEVKDDKGLNDFQKLPNSVQIAIPKVGIERFRIPLRFKHKDGTVYSHDCEVGMSIYLQKHKTGANMSRFCAILQDQSEKEGTEGIVDQEFLKTILNRYRTELRDEESEALIPEADIKIKFSYPVKQPSLKSGNWGWQYYECELKATSTDRGDFINLQVEYEYSSTCPCSLSLSKQYEADYRAGKTTEGSGIASAHSQRSRATLNSFFRLEDFLYVEDIVALLRKAIPTETQSLVKRVDEQAFAILNGENPMFVEHASRRLSVVLDQEARLLDWNVKIEHIESLHSHNAVAFIHKQ